ncbi:MAG: hypothetical protein ACYTG0_19440 [Planctomycetota bacterium]|jgi:hypothetical protein
MSFLKRCLGLLAVLLGVAGLAACLLGIVGAWVFGSRLSHTTTEVFTQIDASVIAIRDHVGRTRERIHESRQSVGSLSDRLKRWVSKKTLPRVFSNAELNEIGRRLASALQRADEWLELSQSSARLAQQALSLASRTDATIQSDFVDSLLRDVESMRDRLAQAATLVNGIRERISGDPGDHALEEHVPKAVRAVLTVVASLDALDARFGRMGESLDEARGRLQRLQRNVLRWLLVGQIVATLLLAWLGAGQASLVLHGWGGFRLKRRG